MLFRSQRLLPLHDSASVRIRTLILQRGIIQCRPLMWQWRREEPRTKSPKPCSSMANDLHRNNWRNSRPEESLPQRRFTAEEIYHRDHGAGFARNPILKHEASAQTRRALPRMDTYETRVKAEDKSFRASCRCRRNFLGINNLRITSANFSAPCANFERE